MATDAEKIKIKVLPTEDITSGEPNDDGGERSVTAAELDEIKKSGRLAEYDKYEQFKSQLKAQQRADQKGNWPLGYGEAVDANGEKVPYYSVTVKVRNPELEEGAPLPSKAPDPIPPVTATPKAVDTAFGNTQGGPSAGGVASNQQVRILSKDPSLIADYGLLKPLKKTGNGVYFPFTPTINFTHSASYGSYDITHSIYQQNFYQMSPNPTINLTASFAPQTIDDMAYAVAALNFFKSCTKGDFGAYTVEGRVNEKAGLPPPVLVLSGYGHLNMNNVPVIVRSVNYTFPEDTDYVMLGFDGDRYYEIPFNDVEAEAAQGQFNQGTEALQDIMELPGGYISLPSMFLLSLDLIVQYPPSKVRNEFDIRAYRSGIALSRGFM